MDKKIIVIGSSISWGAWDEDGGWVDRIKRLINKKVVKTNEEYYCMLYNLSISGDTSSGIVDRFDRELSLRLGEDQETILIFEIGINDSMYLNAEKEFQIPKKLFKSNIKLLIKKSQKLANKIIFIGAPPVIDSILDPIPWHLEGTYKTKYAKEFNDILFEECKKHGVEYVDIFSKFEQGELKMLMSPDGVHPSTKGHEAIFKTMLKVLKRLKVL